MIGVPFYEKLEHRMFNSDVLFGATHGRPMPRSWRGQNLANPVFVDELPKPFGLHSNTVVGAAVAFAAKEKKQQKQAHLKLKICSYWVMRLPLLHLT